jgi:hypothetical protein
MADARTIIDSAICNGIIKVGLIAGDEFGVNIMYKAMLVETIFEKKNTSTYVLEALKSSIKAKKHRKERRGTGLDLRWCFYGSGLAGSPRAPASPGNFFHVSTRKEVNMISLRMLFGSKAPVPAMLAVVLVMSACVGQPPRLEEPSQVTISTLNRINSHPCTPTVASALDAYRVPSESIRDFFYTQRLSGESRLLGYTAWMHLTDQPGYLVVDVDRSCQFEQAYTRGGANLPGVYRALF